MGVSVGQPLIIKDDYLESPSLAQCSPKARDYWHRICKASTDAYGCFKWNILEIRAKAFPPHADPRWKKIRDTDVEKWLAEYEAVGMLQVWDEGTKRYGFWTGWWRHNREDTRYKRKTPPPPQVVEPLLHCKYTEVTGELRRPSSSSSSHSSSHSNSMFDSQMAESFDRFWSAYFRKEKKDEAREAWKRANPPVEKVMATLKWQAPEMLEREKRHRPLASTWINNRRWTDEPDGASPHIKPKRCKCGHVPGHHTPKCIVGQCECSGFREGG